MTDKYFSLKNSKYSRYPGLAPLMYKLLYLDECNKLYDTAPLAAGAPAVLNHILQSIGISIAYDQNAFFNIPTAGPLLVTSNHPFGGLDGMVIASLLLRRRQDVRVLANYLLQLIDPIAPLFIPLDPFAKTTNKRNVQGLKEASTWLRKEKTLLIFPSGTVSHLRLFRGQIEDPPWNPIAAKLAQKYQATVIPAYVHGRNSWYFQLAGMIHPLLRTMLLPQQLYAKRKSTVRISLGAPITFSELKERGTVDLQTQFLREQTYALRNTSQNHVIHFNEEYA